MTPDIAKNVREHLKSECEKQELPISPDEKASYELFGSLTTECCRMLQQGRPKVVRKQHLSLNYYIFHHVSRVESMCELRLG